MKQLVQTNTQNSVIDVVDKLYRYSEILADSNVIPAHYRKQKSDIFVAAQTAYRMNLDPLMVMQGTYIIKGKLGMTSAFAISLANSSGVLNGGIRYKIEDKGIDLKVTAFATYKENNEEISYTISMKEAQAEGWTSNPKYRTLPELMLRYRSAILLIRTHIPQVLNGMHTVEELKDVEASKTVGESKTETLNKKIDSFFPNNKDNKLEIELNKEGLIIAENQQDKLHQLIEKHQISEEMIGKWCDKAGVETIEELDQDKVQSCIDYIAKKNDNVAEILI